MLPRRQAGRRFRRRGDLDTVRFDDLVLLVVTVEEDVDMVFPRPGRTQRHTRIHPKSERKLYRRTISRLAHRDLHTTAIASVTTAARFRVPAGLRTARNGPGQYDRAEYYRHPDQLGHCHHPLTGE